jgi:hypothetical protein
MTIEEVVECVEKAQSELVREWIIGRNNKPLNEIEVEEEDGNDD